MGGVLWREGRRGAEGWRGFVDGGGAEWEFAWREGGSQTDRDKGGWEVIGVS
jgi:hypothetical protein